MSKWPCRWTCPAARVWFVLAKCLLLLHIVSPPRRDHRCQIALPADWLFFFFFFTSSVDSKLKTGVTLSSSHCKKNQAKREQKRVHSAQVLSSTLLHIWRNSPRCCHGGFSGCLLCLWCHCHMSNKDRNATWWQCCSPFKDRGACWSLAHSVNAPQGKRLLRALKNVYAWREHGTARIGIL